MARPPRRLSDDDRATWDRVAATLTPLAPTPAPVTTTAKPAPRPHEVPRPTRTAARLKRGGGKPQVSVHLIPDPMDRLAQSPARMDAKAFGRLRRGKLEPEARIDLHGMTAARAHSVLRRFIHRAHRDGVRLVLVITGKGRPAAPEESSSRRGVLRTAVPDWLMQPDMAPMILQISPAHMKHGGGGAYYVYLSRAKGCTGRGRT